MVSRARLVELCRAWGAEAGARRWRAELTDEERALVAHWDEVADEEFLRLCDAIFDIAELAAEMSVRERREGAI